MSAAALSFALLAAALLVLVGHGLAADRAARSAWWLSARWRAASDALGVAGRALLFASACILGLAAMG